MEFEHFSGHGILVRMSSANPLRVDRRADHDSKILPSGTEFEPSLRGRQAQNVWKT